MTVANSIAIAFLMAYRRMDWFPKVLAGGYYAGKSEKRGDFWRLFQGRKLRKHAPGEECTFLMIQLAEASNQVKCDFDEIRLDGGGGTGEFELSSS